MLGVANILSRDPLATQGDGGVVTGVLHGPKGLAASAEVFLNRERNCQSTTDDSGEELVVCGLLVACRQRLHIASAVSSGDASDRKVPTRRAEPSDRASTDPVLERDGLASRCTLTPARRPGCSGLV